MIFAVAAGGVAALWVAWKITVAGYRTDSAWTYLRYRTEWQNVPFRSSSLEALPLAVCRFFGGAIKDGAPIRSVVELKATSTAARYFQVVAFPHGIVSRRYSAKPWFPACEFLIIGDTQLAGHGPPLDLGGFIKRRPAAEEDLFDRLLMAAVLWAPGSLLPSKHVQWTSENDSIARADISDGNHYRVLELSLGENGLLSLATVRRREGVALTAVPTKFREIGGCILPTVVAFDADLGAESGLSQVKVTVESLRPASPWIGSSHV